MIPSNPIADQRVAPERPLHFSKSDVLVPALLTLCSRFVLKVVPLGTLARLVGLSVRPSTASDDLPHPSVSSVRNRMSFVSTHYPMLGDCVPQCIAAAILLRLHGIQSTLHFGVIKSPFADDPLQAHAWLSSAGIVVAGNGSSAVYQELGRQVISSKSN